LKLWRISDFANLSGDGGLRFSARWHTVGHRIVYCAEHPAGSLVEHLVHINWGVMPDRFQLLTIDIEDGVAMDEIAAENLPDGWRNDLAVTRSKGDAWLASDSTLLCRVPSVILPDVYNVLVNPAHPDMARTKIVNRRSVPLDSRLGPGKSQTTSRNQLS